MKQKSILDQEQAAPLRAEQSLPTITENVWFATHVKSRRDGSQKRACPLGAACSFSWELRSCPLFLSLQNCSLAHVRPGAEPSCAWSAATEQCGSRLQTANTPGLQA